MHRRPHRHAQPRQRTLSRRRRDRMRRRDGRSRRQRWSREAVSILASWRLIRQHEHLVGRRIVRKGERGCSVHERARRRCRLRAIERPRRQLLRIEPHGRLRTIQLARTTEIGGPKRARELVDGGCTSVETSQAGSVVREHQPCAAPTLVHRRAQPRRPPKHDVRTRAGEPPCALGGSRELSGVRSASERRDCGPAPAGVAWQWRPACSTSLEPACGPGDAAGAPNRARNRLMALTLAMNRAASRRLCFWLRNSFVRHVGPAAMAQRRHSTISRHRATSCPHAHALQGASSTVLSLGSLAARRRRSLAPSRHASDERLRRHGSLRRCERVHGRLCTWRASMVDLTPQRDGQDCTGRATWISRDMGRAFGVDTSRGIINAFVDDSNTKATVPEALAASPTGWCRSVSIIARSPASRAHADEHRPTVTTASKTRGSS